MTRSKPDLSIVVPAYNEETRLPPTLDIILEWQKTSGLNVEVVVVDDGSADRTCELVEQYAEKNPFIKLRRNSHLGYMNAIITGLHAAEAPFRGTLEADCPVHPRYFQQFLPLMANYDIVMGSRKLRGEDSVVEGKSLFRRFLSAGMSGLFTTLFKLRILDPQIGFKLFRAEVVEKVLPMLALSHDGLKSSETLVKADALGFRIKEVPVKYRHDPDSRCVPKNPYKVVWGALCALFELWVLSYSEFKRGVLPKSPVRGTWLIGPFWRLVPEKSR